MSSINHVAVRVAGIVQFMLGAGWYTAARQRLAGRHRQGRGCNSRPKSATRRCLTSFRSSTGLVIAYTLAWLLAAKSAPQSAAAGAKTGALLALALIGDHARAELRLRGARRVAVAHQRGLHDRRHGDHGRHHRRLAEGRVTET